MSQIRKKMLWRYDLFLRFSVNSKLIRNEFLKFGVREALQGVFQQNTPILWKNSVLLPQKLAP